MIYFSENLICIKNDVCLWKTYLYQDWYIFLKKKKILYVKILSVSKIMYVVENLIFIKNDVCWWKSYLYQKWCLFVKNLSVSRIIYIFLKKKIHWIRIWIKFLRNSYTNNCIKIFFVLLLVTFLLLGFCLVTLESLNRNSKPKNQTWEPNKKIQTKAKSDI